MRRTRPAVTSMRLPADSGNRLKRVANRHGWTQSDTSAQLVEEGLRRTEFAYIDCRDSAVGRQAYMRWSRMIGGRFPSCLRPGEKKNERTVG